MLLKSVLMGFLSFHSVDTNTLKECKSEEDRISGCAERAYHSNGKLMREIPFKNGEKEGMLKWYYENGNLWSETPFKNGEFDGVAKAYYKNGKLKIELPYKNYKREGIEKRYYENGKLMAEIPHLNGLFHGGGGIRDSTQKMENYLLCLKQKIMKL